MPHESLKLKPGVDTNETPVLNQGGISSTQLIRFMPDQKGLGLPQKLGGWTRFYEDAMATVVRALHAWADTNSANHLAIGCEGGLFVDGLNDRSPQRNTVNIAVDFSTTSGSSTVTITDASSGSSSNNTSFDSIFIKNQVSIGGLILSGFYPIISGSTNTYQITARNILGIEELATATETNAGTVPELTTISGDYSVNVLLVDHGLSVNSTFTILVKTTVGGVDFYGNYVVQEVVDDDNFKILSFAPPTSSEVKQINGGKVRIEYFYGQATVPASGYGAGGYGLGLYGEGEAGSTGNRTIDILTGSMTGSNINITFSPNYNIQAGSQITISGATPSGYNGTYTIISSGNGKATFKRNAGALGPMTVPGIFTVNSFGILDANDWTLDNWGEYLVACPEDGPIFYWNPNDTGTFSIVMPNAPNVNEGMFIAMPQRQVIAYGSTFTGIQDPLLIRWCDVGNFTSWIAMQKNQAGSFRISRGSKIIGAMQVAQQGLIWTDIGLWSMQYIGPPYVYSTNEVGTGCGLISKKAAASLAGVTYWMSKSQFFKFTGAGVEPVFCPIWDIVFQKISENGVENIRAASNSMFGEITWYFPTDNSGSSPATYVKYNVNLNCWDYGTLTRTAWIDKSVFGPPIGSDGNNVIMQHETSNDADGSAMISSFTTGYFALSEGDVFTFLDQLWPDMKWGQLNEDQGATIRITFYGINYPNDEPTVYGPFVVDSTTKFITPRIRNRMIAIKIESRDLGSFWRLGNIRYRIQQDGGF